MFDLNLIRDNPDVFDKALARRGEGPVATRLLELDTARRKLQTLVQEAQAQRNKLSAEIGKSKAAGKDAENLLAEVGKLKTLIQDNERRERELADELNGLLAELPNLPHEGVPDGEGEDQNRLVREVGERREFDFEPREHFDLGEDLGLMDFEAAARMSGARFVVLRGALARLERVLGQFMLDLHTTRHGYEEVATPVLVRQEALFGTGQLPKFADDLYRTEDGMWLIPTAEVTLSNLAREEILAGGDLPLRVTSLTPCFRSEAGSAGKDTRGMIRQHQFSKVELVSITAPEDSEAELERMTGCAEEVLKQLGLAYRVMELSTGDMSFSAQRTYDLEVWLPGQGRYREISSCSTCGDFQARRMNMRYRNKGDKESRFPHTLNGSGLALGRALIAIIETYQRADGSIEIPEVLHSYMNGEDSIGTP
jgi:seryl-tRNA synthetase